MEMEIRIMKINGIMAALNMKQNERNKPPHGKEMYRRLAARTDEQINKIARRCYM